MRYQNAPINHIAYLRSIAGLTQKSLADSAGVNIRLVQKLEGNEASPENITLKNAIAISRALGVSPEDLVKRSESIYTPEE
jgi:transcriptional regulator with XRE-family HTH domain